MLATVEEEGEGNFARALFLIRKLRHEMQSRGLSSPDDATVREWYLRILEREYFILKEMGRDEEELQVLRLIERLYQPLPALHLWPLIRLARFDEAREWVDKAEKMGLMKRSLLNSRATIEVEAGRRRECYEASKAAVQAFGDSAVLWSNHAEICYRTFRFAEGAEAIEKATQCRATDYSGCPFTELAWVMAEKGQLPEAWACLKRCRSSVV